MGVRRSVLSLLAVSVATVAVVAPTRRADAEPQAAEACAAWDVEYTLAARLQLADTPMGAGNGVYPVGPGTAVLRFPNANGGGAPPSGSVVTLRSYAMREFFRIDATAVFWKTHVITDTKTMATPDACGDIARGQLDGTNLRWTTPASGYRTDGTLNCDGSLCGSFGGPPSGTSELHIPPHSVQLGAFRFGPDMKTFTMPSTLVAKTESPKQTAYIAVSGREARRTCVAHVTRCP